MLIRATVLVELEVLTKNEKQVGDRNLGCSGLSKDTKTLDFFKKMATAHKRYNAIDRLKNEGEEVVQALEIAKAMMD